MVTMWTKKRSTLVHLFSLLLSLVHQTEMKGGGGSGRGGGGGGGRSPGTNLGRTSTSGDSPDGSLSFREGTGKGSLYASEVIKRDLLQSALGWYILDINGRHIIRAAGAALSYNDIRYFWGRRYFRPINDDYYMCEFPFEPDDKIFGNIEFRTGGAPIEINFGCLYSQSCCGIECCDDDNSIGVGWIIFIILLVLAILLAVSYFFVLPKLGYMIVCPCSEEEISDNFEFTPDKKTVKKTAACCHSQATSVQKNRQLNLNEEETDNAPKDKLEIEPSPIRDSFSNNVMYDNRVAIPIVQQSVEAPRGNDYNINEKNMNVLPYTAYKQGLIL